MPTNRKGDRRERELVNELDERGWAVMRAPSSGSATQRELPDVLAGNGERTYAFEAKASSEKPIYLDEREVENLRHFASKFGAQPRLAIRYDYRDWAFFDPGHPLVHQTDGGNYRVRREDVDGRDGIDVDGLDDL